MQGKQNQIPILEFWEVEYDKVFHTVHCKPFDFDIQLL